VPGAGHGDEGDASFQGPAQAHTLPAQPKPTNLEAATDVASSVVARTNATDGVHGTGGFVTVRPKPEKRKNAKERAKEKFTRDRTTPDTTAKAKSKVETKKAKKSKSTTDKAT